MSMKTIAALWLLAGATTIAGAKPAPAPTPVKTVVGNVTAIDGIVGTGTDYFALGHDNGTVTWLVPKGLASGSYDVFTDVYNFETLGSTEVTGSASVTGGKDSNFSLAGNTGDLLLYEGTYQVGTALGGYTLEGETSFTSAGASLDKVLDEGHHFFVLEGTTSGSKGGKYDFEVTAVTQASAVPEPGSIGLLLAGVAVLGGLSQRRKRA